MSSEDEITLTLHGLDEHHHDVDGEVFARTFKGSMKALGLSDAAANGKRRLKFFISGLARNTASASVREQIVKNGPPAASGLRFYQRALTSIAQDDPSALALPKDLVKAILRLNEGAGESFAFGEVKFKTGPAVLIDAQLRERAESVLRHIEANENRELFFKGQAYGAFDGVLKVIDLRGDAKRAVLRLSAGHLEVPCRIDGVGVETLRSALDTRAMVYGLAHYDGTRGLPVRLDVGDIVPCRDDADLTKWRGAFDIPEYWTGEDWGDI